MNPTNTSSAGGTADNAILGLSSVGLQWFNAVSNNVFPSSSLTTGPTGIIATSGSVNSSFLLLALLAILAAFYLFVRH